MYCKTKNLWWVVMACFLVMVASCSSPRTKEASVLVFSKTTEWYHESIPAGNRALIQLGEDWGFSVDTTTDASLFTRDQLKEYSVVVFLNTTGDVLDDDQQQAFEQFIGDGGGFVGIHGAADTEHDWEWYGGLVGAYFEDHPEIQKADLFVQNRQHPATQMLPEKWVRTDEWYNFKNIQKDIEVLITIDEDSYKGGTNGSWHPISWYREYEGGRSFYTGLGHGDETYEDPVFLEHLVGGISYAMYGNDQLLQNKSSE